MNDTQLYAGSSKRIITPENPGFLTGFGARRAPATGVHDDLRACALYLRSGTVETVIVTADLIGFSAAETACLRQAVQAGCALPESSLMLSCSHTHSGPATGCLSYLGKVDPLYITWLIGELAAMVADAKANAQKAKAGWKKIPVQIGINRRQSLDGKVILGKNPEGIVSTHADVLRVDDAIDGKPLACLVNHTAHPVSLTGKNLEISGDWPGYFQRELEEKLGGNATVLFQQGCCGNVNCREKGGFAEAEKQGKILASVVWDSFPSIATEANLELSIHQEILQLPLLPPPPVGELRKKLPELRANAKAAPPDNLGIQMMTAGIVEWTEKLIAIADSGETDRKLPFEIQTIHIGNQAIVGLPAEAFQEYAAHLAPAVVAGYTNGNIGYLPTKAAHAQGGYEVEGAIAFYGTTMPIPDVESKILNAASIQIGQSPLLGLDVGGTKCAVLLGLEDGLILDRREFPSEADRGPDAMLADLLCTARELLAGRHPAAVGVSIGGPMNANEGQILSPPGLPGWDHIPLQQILEKEFAAPARIEHDAAACALAEYTWGFPGEKAPERLLYLTCATGFGVGMVFSGMPYYGNNGQSPEIGHVKIADDGPDAFGGPGSAESFCSARSLTRLALWKFPNRWTPANEPSPREIGQLWKQGDPDARWIVECNAKMTGRVCAYLGDTLRPDHISLGSLARYLGEDWLKLIREEFTTRVLPATAQSCTLAAAKLGEQLQDLSALAAAKRAKQN